MTNRTVAHVGMATRTDRTRSSAVREREAGRRMARQLKRTPAPLDLDALRAELCEVAR